MKFVSFNENYLSRKQTQCINGFFVFLIFLSHFSTYIDTTLPFNHTYIEIKTFLRQLVVVTFLLFSGYGMFESFKKKGKDYIKTLPNRFLNLLIKYDIAVIMFLIVAIIVGRKLTLKKVLLSFIAYESLGNSNWYIFAIFCMYIIMFICFTVFKYDKNKSLSAMFFGVFGYIFLCKYLGTGGWWYNTILCFPLGMLLSYYKDDITSILKKSNVNYILLLLIAIFIFFFSHYYMLDFLYAYEINALSFCVIIVLISNKIIMHNPILYWLGEHTFSIYILQRIPMIFGKKIGLSQYFILYFVISLITTLVIAIIFDKYSNKINFSIYKNDKYS